MPITVQKPANQSVAKLFQLIAYLSECKGAVRLQQIATDTGMPQATVLRYLNSLIQEGYAFQDAITERYYLTWRICGIGEQVRAHMSLRMLSGNIVSELSSKLELGIGLVIENNLECMYLDCVYEPLNMGGTLQRIGKRTPMHSTSSGKLFLSQFSNGELDRLIEEKGLPALTERTITTKDALLAELEITRSRGYAVDNEECEDGLRCVSVPICDYTDRISAAICCFGKSEKFSDTDISQSILPLLFDAAQEISFRMGHGTPGNHNDLATDNL